MLNYDKGKNNINRGQWLCEYGSSFVQIEVDVTYAYFFAMNTCGLKSLFLSIRPTTQQNGIPMLKNILYFCIHLLFHWDDFYPFRYSPQGQYFLVPMHILNNIGSTAMAQQP